MKYTVTLCAVLAVIAVKIVQVWSLQTYTVQDSFRTRIDLKDPSWGSSSSIILKSHLGFSYTGNRNNVLLLAAPSGYGLLVAARLLDLRPNNQDFLRLSVDGPLGREYRYSNSYAFRNRKFSSREDLMTFYAPNGQINVTFSTGPSILTVGYGGFELTVTVQSDSFRCKYADFHCSNGRCVADILTCDDHNHCGDRSDQRDCNIFPIPGKGRVVGIAFGTVFMLIALLCIIYIFVKRASRSRIEERTVITTHPPTTNMPSYPPPETCYPPPPPPYSPYNQGVTNPGFR